MIKKDIKKIYTALILIILSTTVFLFTSCFSPEILDKKEEITPGITVEIVVKEGMTLQQISELLESSGIVDNAFMFRLFVQQRGKERNMAPGKYEMVTCSDYDEALQKLVAGPPETVYKVTIPEGLTVKEILEKYGLELPFLSIGDMEIASRVSNYNYEYLTGCTSLEGFLFPKTYEVLLDYDASDVIEMMLAQYQFETGDLDYSLMEEVGLSRYDILKIASMIEREAYIPEERELISAVIHNRLNIGMALGIDATLSYYLDKWEEPLTQSDLDIDTEYNTRLYKGLPPTPICNPGLNSIIAALNPADVDYLYYVVTDSSTHRHSFTNDPDEHLDNIKNAK
jgi:UPF0755 protein